LIELSLLVEDIEHGAAHRFWLGRRAVELFAATPGMRAGRTLR
jgi:hypothetical protein